MRVAVIGCGSIGARHARNAAALGHDVMLCDVNEQQAIEAKCSIVLNGGGYVHYKNVRDLIENGPDAVMVCTPARTHAAVARELLATGYDGALFVEKPLALSVQECAIFQAWPHPTTMVGYNWIFNEEVKHWLSWRYNLALPLHFWCDTDMRTWPGHDYAEPLVECSHEIHAILWERRFSIHVVSAERPADGDGIRISFDSGDRVTVRWNTQANRSFSAGESSRLLPTQQPIDDSYRYELANFLGCAERGVPTDTPFVDGMRVLDVIEQAKEMAACAR